jgi:hypothetical protein
MSIPLAPTVFASVGGTSPLGSDFHVTAGQSGSDITISVDQVKGTTITPVVGTWYYPTT